MVDRIRPIALATLANLSKNEGNRTFSLHEIITRAAKLFSLDYNELRNPWGSYLAGAVSSGEDPHFTGDPYHEFYMLTNAGQHFQASIVAAAAGAASHQQRSNSRPSSSSGFIPGTLVRSAASARDDDDYSDSGTALAASSSSQRSRNHPSVHGNMTDKRGCDQQSSSSSSIHPAEKRPRYSGDDKAGGGTAAAGRKVATTMKPSSSSSQPIVDPTRGSHGGKPERACEQFNLATGRTIARFDSLGDATRATGIPRSSIRDCVGFGWREQGAAATGAASASRIGAISKKPSSSNGQSNDKNPHGGHVGKPVDQYDLATGKTIARFKNQSDAERATGISNGGISSCVRGKVTHAGGFGWWDPQTGGDKKLRIFADKVLHGSHVGKPVEQYDLATGKTIARFKNQSAAEKATGVGNASISKCANGGCESAGGYGWRSPGTGGAAGAANGSHFSRLALSNPFFVTFSIFCLLP